MSVILFIRHLIPQFSILFFGIQRLAYSRLVFVFLYLFILFILMPKVPHHDPSEIRVHLFGRVGSSDAPRRSFVLKSPDDRSLPVSILKKCRLPPVGVEISVSGRLRLGEGDDVVLEMTSGDQWSRLSRSKVNALTQ